MNILLLIVLCLELLFLYFLCRYGYMAYRLYKSGKTRTQGAFMVSVYYCFLSLLSMLLLVSFYAYVCYDGRGENPYERWLIFLGIICLIGSAFFFVFGWIYKSIKYSLVSVAEKRNISRIRYVSNWLFLILTILFSFLWLRYNVLSF